MRVGILVDFRCKTEVECFYVRSCVVGCYIYVHTYIPLSLQFIFHSNFSMFRVQLFRRTWIIHGIVIVCPKNRKIFEGKALGKF